jgi:ABC-type bacteriocin/lantibiotic exporter with double-glycine peptidase domain
VNAPPGVSDEARDSGTLVLRGGERVEHGTHEALVAQGGLYAELFHLQAAGYH